MAVSFLQLQVSLLVGVAIIIVLTARFKVHAFFALFIACFVVGLGIQMPLGDIINTAKEGFGSILKSLGFIIVLGTALGVVLQHGGCTGVMATFILNKTGRRYPALAMAITGFIVGLPIFCDSGYIVLSGLNRSIAKRTGVPMAFMAAALATGLYSVHCLIPPHPGAGRRHRYWGLITAGSSFLALLQRYPPCLLPLPGLNMRAVRQRILYQSLRKKHHKPHKYQAYLFHFCPL
jgi:GntP family gluconate:H+ symporter